MKRLEIFFALHPVFTVDEIKGYLSDYSSQKNSIANLLHYHHKQGRIFPVRRGLYYVVPPGTDLASCSVDGYLVAGKLAKDSVLAYHTALSFHGHSHSVWYQFYYFTKNRAKKPFIFRGYTFKAVSIPSALMKSQSDGFGVKIYEHSGVKIAITTPERTFVDILHRPYLGGSWEEIWKSLGSIEYLDLDQVIEYTLLLSNDLVNAKVGYFLQIHKDQFRVSEVHLEKLHRYISSNPRYLERFPKGEQKLIQDWNLIIPKSLYEHSWEEPHGNF